MAISALERLKSYSWITRYFLNFIEADFGDIEIALEEITPKKLTLYFVKNNVLNIVSTPLDNSVYFDVTTQSLPLSEIVQITTQYDRHTFDSKSVVHLDEIGFRSTIIFKNFQFTIDVTNSQELSYGRISYARQFISRLREALN